VKTVRSGARDAEGNLPPEVWAYQPVSPTLNAFDNGGDSRATVLIIDGTRVDDVRVYDDEISQTVISRWGTGGGNVPYVFPIQSTVIGRQDHNGPQGKGYGMETDPMFTLDRVGAHGVAMAYDEYNDSIAETHHTLRAGTKQSTGAIQQAVVRRLTPTECERLQGFPDGHTEDQADSHRYKQMGNAVTVNVIRWIGERL